MRVLVAGCGGASLGTEIIKSLNLAGKYKIYACDISEYAYGLYMNECENTFRIPSDEEQYLKSILRICRDNKIKIIIPGGEKPAEILRKSNSLFLSEKITVVLNNIEVCEICSDKKRTFDVLRKLNIAIPATYDKNSKQVKYPCIIKPAKDSGGSNFVFIAENETEKNLYVEYLDKNKKQPIIQEYISIEGGEYTVGVLSLLSGEIYGSICLKRVFYNKLSIMQQNEFGIISSGYTQGNIVINEKITKTAENIARQIGSTGPLNIQGRIKNGEFVPFEINPRFSASTYLRALAGFNEIDIYIRNIYGETNFEKKTIKEGYCGRSFTECFIEKENMHDSLD